MESTEKILIVAFIALTVICVATMLGQRSEALFAEATYEAFPGQSTCKYMVEICAGKTEYSMLFTNEVDLNYLQQRVIRHEGLIYINPAVRIRPNVYLRK